MLYVAIKKGPALTEQGIYPYIDLMRNINSDTIYLLGKIILFVTNCSPAKSGTIATYM
jgi:hypothetical protein